MAAKPAKKKAAKKKSKRVPGQYLKDVAEQLKAEDLTIKREPAKIGRPTDLTDQLADEICLRIEGRHSGLRICRELGLDYGTMCRWIARDEGFREKYLRAKEIMADGLHEEQIDIADEDPLLVFHDVPNSENTIIRVDGACVAHQALRIKTRQHYAAITAPRKYSLTQRVQPLGKDGEPADPSGGAQVLFCVTVNGGPPPGLSPEFAAAMGMPAAIEAKPTKKRKSK